MSINDLRVCLLTISFGWALAAGCGGGGNDGGKGGSSAGGNGGSTTGSAGKGGSTGGGGGGSTGGGTGGAAGTGGSIGGTSGGSGGSTGGTGGSAGAPGTGGSTGGAAGTGGSAGGTAGTAGSGGSSAGGTGGAAGAGGSTGGAGGATGGAGGATGGSSGTGGAAGTGGAGGTGGRPEVVCPAISPATDYGCTKMAPFTATTQMLDAYGDEFCDIPPVHFTAGDAPYKEGETGSMSAPNPPPPEEITFRAGWSTDAFHFHAHIVDPTICVNSDLTGLYNGDELELFVAGGTDFTVTYPTGTSANAILIGISPARGSIPSRAVLYRNQQRTAFDQQYWATRLTADGWEVEVKLPWPGTLMPAAAGSTVGFQLGLSMAEVQGGNRVEFATLPIPTGVTGTTCPQNHAMPWCDDRTWCKPVAQ